MNTAAMAMERTTTCAVPKCTMPVSYPNNLCDGHRLPGLVVINDASDASGSTFIIPGWYTEHGEYIPHGAYIPNGGKTPYVNGRPFVITVWYAEHGDEVGLIHLSDFALGDLFGGRPRFEAQLAKQGFTRVHNISTPEELEAAKQPAPGRKAGDWSGPWLLRYQWEIRSTCGDELIVQAHKGRSISPEDE